MNLRKWIGLACMLLLMTACQPYQYKGTYLEPAEPITTLSLQSTQGEVFELTDLGDKVLLVYFGYTHCPDICPNTLYKVNQVMESLGTDAERVQVAMITVDPDRDTANLLDQYMTSFSPAYFGLYEPDAEKLAAIMADFGVFAETEEADSTGSYLVSHSSYLFLLDQTGMRLLFSYDMPAEDIASDLREFLK